MVNVTMIFSSWVQDIDESSEESADATGRKLAKGQQSNLNLLSNNLSAFPGYPQIRAPVDSHNFY